MSLYLCYLAILYPSLLSMTIWTFNSLISCNLQVELPPVLRFHCKFGDDVSDRCLQLLPLFSAETLIPKISCYSSLMFARRRNTNARNNRSALFQRARSIQDQKERRQMMLKSATARATKKMNSSKAGWTPRLLATDFNWAFFYCIALT